MFSLRRHPSSPLLFRLQRARPTPTYKTNIITNPATNTINLATNLLQISSIWQQIQSIWQQISREGCTNKWETRFFVASNPKRVLVASYPDRDLLLHITQNKICGSSLFESRCLPGQLSWSYPSWNLWLGMEWYLQQTVASKK